MAVLAVTSSTARVPVGPYWMQTFRVTTGAASAVEYFVTGFSNVITVVGDAILGITAGAGTSNYILNAQATSGTAGDYPGDLAIETTAGFDMEVTVLGQ